ncbi:MAG: Thymidylate kinase [Candidatus Heimdallarchaeota archaeon LC_3]|nr:MAG: Thymidylate kinase [Candidatus Heimdallarchaeota archaeon LC_3]
MHIAIEGMDGVGKTTVAGLLAKKLDFSLVEKPLHFLLDEEGSFTNYIKIRDYINLQINNDALRAWFYGLGNIFLYHKFKNENIITDRHLVSNYYWCGTEETETIFQNIINIIGRPDFTILLFASKEVGQKRIINRDPNDSDVEKTELYAESKTKMEDFLNKFDMEFVSIDTSFLSPEDVTQEIINCLPIRKKIE